jgi:Lrp/AsnC family transcriptional regulator, regulator for asnA, asnC and gidA
MPRFDKTDFEIISLLQRDGRMPFVKMAQVLGVSEGTIRRKVSSLVGNGTLVITAVCNPSALGYDAPAIVGISADQKKCEEIAKQISQIPEVQFAVITTGPYEIMIQVHAESNEDLFKMLLRIAELDGVKATQTFLMLRTYKLSGNIEITGKQAPTVRKKKHILPTALSSEKDATLKTAAKGRKERTQK